MTGMDELEELVIEIRKFQRKQQKGFKYMPLLDNKEVV